MWTGLVEWMAEAGMAGGLDGPEWSDGDARFAARDRIDRAVEAFTSGFHKAAFASEAQRRRLPWASVDGPEEVAFNPQLLARRFFAWVETDTVCARDVGFAVADLAVDRPVRLRVPGPGTAPTIEDEWLPAASSTTDRPAGATRTAGRPALDGVRVLDLTWVLAGPYATKILADHGADVIKVESRQRPDPTRFARAMHLTRAEDEAVDPDRSGYFNNFNRNKRGIALNLRDPRGIPLLARLVPHCDVIVENFSAGVMERWGLGYEALRALRPDVILVRMAGMGQTGPWRDRVTYADALAALAGITAATGAPDEDPVGVAFGLGDIVAALHAVVGTLAALEDRAVTGRGREIDLSQLEALASHTGAAVLEAALGVPSTSSEGNRHLRMAPHGPFPCEGEDRWVAVAVETNAQWRALCSVVGRPDAGLDSRFATLAGRKVNEAEVEGMLTTWTRGRTAEEAASLLQSAGIPAAPVQDGLDLVERDGHLRARGFYVSLRHPAAGEMLHEGLAIRLGQNPGGVHRPAPRLGEHTDQVLEELLGMPAPEIEELHRAGVLE